MAATCAPHGLDAAAGHVTTIGTCGRTRPHSNPPETSPHGRTSDRGAPRQPVHTRRRGHAGRHRHRHRHLQDAVAGREFRAERGLLHRHVAAGRVRHVRRRALLRRTGQFAAERRRRISVPEGRYGPKISVLFAWARCSVIQPGAIAAVAFVLGDYANVLLNLGTYGPAIYAVIGVLVVTTINFAGTLQGKQTQLVLSLLTVAAVLVVAVAGFMAPAPSSPPPASRDLVWGLAGLSMVFVLLTYGGWNEAAYLSGEIKDVKRNMVRALMLGVAVIVACYLLINFAYLHALGIDGLRKSNAVGADLMKIVAGTSGAAVLSIIVCITAGSTLNGTIFTGARSYYALGRDVSVFRHLGIWEERGGTPANGLIVPC